MALGSAGAGIINACFERKPRYLLVDEIEHLKQSDQAALLSLMQSGVLVETKVSKTRHISTIMATCIHTKRLKAPLLSRFAVINIPEYDKEQFVRNRKTKKERENALFYFCPGHDPGSSVTCGFPVGAKGRCGFPCSPVLTCGFPLQPASSFANTGVPKDSAPIPIATRAMRLICFIIASSPTLLYKVSFLSFFYKIFQSRLFGDASNCLADRCPCRHYPADL